MCESQICCSMKAFGLNCVNSTARTSGPHGVALLRLIAKVCLSLQATELAIVVDVWAEESHVGG
nr:MAG TPA: hypothetical protein [Caudoviricetes sp.]